MDVAGVAGAELMGLAAAGGGQEAHPLLELEQLLVEALQLNERLGNRWGIAANSLRYAEFLEMQSQPERAFAYAQRARALFCPRSASHR